MFVIEKGTDKVNSTDIRTAVDIIIGLVDNPEIENEAYNFMYKASFGDKYYNKATGLTIKCVQEPYCMKNKDIINRIKQVMTNPLSKTERFGLRFYYDGCWGIRLERLPESGVIRFWIETENKSSRAYKASLCTVYLYNGELRWSMEFKPKERVIKKILSLYKDLYKNGLIVS